MAEESEGPVVYGAEGEMTQAEIEAKEAEEAEANDAEAPVLERNVSTYSDYDSGIEPNPEEPIGVVNAVRSDEASAATDQPVVEGEPDVE